MDINYRSDFNLICIFKGPDGETISFPDFDFNIQLFTESNVQYPYPRTFLATKRDNIYYNCSNIDGKLAISADSHRLLPGKLCVKLTAFIEDNLMEDGIRRIEIISQTEINLVIDNTQPVENPVVIISIPFSSNESTPPAISNKEWVDKETLNTILDEKLKDITDASCNCEEATLEEIMAAADAVFNND